MTTARESLRRQVVRDIHDTVAAWSEVRDVRYMDAPEDVAESEVAYIYDTEEEHGFLGNGLRNILTVIVAVTFSFTATGDPDDRESARNKGNRLLADLHAVLMADNSRGGLAELTAPKTSEILELEDPQLGILHTEWAVTYRHSLRDVRSREIASAAA